MANPKKAGSAPVQAAALPLVNFGVSDCVRLVLDPRADVPHAVFEDAACLMGCGLQVLELLTDDLDPDQVQTMFAGLYLLRQAHAALRAGLEAPR